MNKKDTMIGLRSYQDIETPEEKEERMQKIYERRRERLERAELRAEYERDRRNEKD